MERATHTVLGLLVCGKLDERKAPVAAVEFLGQAYALELAKGAGGRRAGNSITK